MWDGECRVGLVRVLCVDTRLEVNGRRDSADVGAAGREGVCKLCPDVRQEKMHTLNVCGDPIKVSASSERARSAQ